MFKIQKTWIAPQWESALKDAGLLDIEAVSKREFDWFETPNHRRGGWSGVTRIVLNPDAAPTDQQAVFLKIQQNHFYRAPSTFFLKRLSFAREFNALQALAPLVNCMPKLLQFSQWKHDGNHGALIITEALEGLEPFDQWLREQKNAPTPHQSAPTLKALKSIATAAREVHDTGWAHFGFYPKHAFIRKDENGDYTTCLIDLEKARQPLSSKQSTIEDVSRFLRHSTELNNEEKVAYLRAYFQTDTFSDAQKSMIGKMHGGPSV